MDSNFQDNQIFVLGNQKCTVSITGQVDFNMICQTRHLKMPLGTLKQI